MGRLTPEQQSEVLDIIPAELDIDTGGGIIHPIATHALWIIANAHDLDLDLGWSTT